MASLTPSQAAPKWTHTAQEILHLARAAITKHKQAEDEVAALSPDNCTLENVFLALSDAETEFDLVADPLLFYHQVSPSKEVRDASNEAEGLVRDYKVDSSMRLDVFQAKQAAQENIKKHRKKMYASEYRLVEKMIMDGTRAGLALPEEDRKKLASLRKELSQASLQFSKNYNEEKGIITFSADELKGVPEDVISSYSKREESGQILYDVTFKTPDISPVTRFANNPKTRQRAFEASENRLGINVPLLDKMLNLRRQIAALLGYDTWADYRTKDKMVKSGQNVAEFLADLRQKLLPVGLKERETLLALKKADCDELGVPFDGVLYAWDFRYYERLLIKQTLSLDDMRVKEYFPVKKVVPAVLSIYQDLLGVEFSEIQGETWHPDVQQFAVWEKDAKDDSGFVGYCYLDLFPRESKYPHAVVWCLQQGFDRSDDTRHHPVVTMVANLAKPTPTRPALMRHEDVVTFFHEMGHVFHGLLSKTKFARFHGTRVARDFVEAPSQMLENWCWEPKVLEKMSSHYETSEPLSLELIAKILQRRYTNVGMLTLRQVYFAQFDIAVHTSKEPVDCTALWNTLRESVSLIKASELTEGQGSFSHLAADYDASVYGYLYSLVFAADMYRTVFTADPLDPAHGQLYRDKILRVGGGRDEIDMLRDFLGREPNSDAFVDEVLRLEQRALLGP